MLKVMAMLKLKTAPQRGFVGWERAAAAAVAVAGGLLLLVVVLLLLLLMLLLLGGGGGGGGGTCMPSRDSMMKHATQLDEATRMYSVSKSNWFIAIFTIWSMRGWAKGRGG